MDELGAAIWETFIKCRYTLDIITSRLSSLSSGLTVGTEPEMVNADDADDELSLGATSTNLAGFDSFSNVVNVRETTELSVVRTFGRQDDVFTWTGFSKESSTRCSLLAVPSMAKQLISICPLVDVRGGVKLSPPFVAVDIPVSVFSFSGVRMFPFRVPLSPIVVASLS